MDRGYHVKLQHQGYTERRTPHNNIYMKIAIEQTRVGLAHAHPNYNVTFAYSKSDITNLV